MNKVSARWPVVVALALGCDDPAVTGALDSVLQHGAVSAQALCEVVDATTVDNGNPDSVGCRINALLDIQKHVDGSASVSSRLPGRDIGTMRIIPRSHDDADDLRTVIDSCSCNSKIRMTVIDGDLVLTLSETQGSCPDVPSPQTFETLDIETECTGFNLEAFD